MALHFDRYWEMQEGGPYDGPEETNKIFKCTDCGAETHHRQGYNGEPDADGCAPECPSRASDWRPGRVSRLYLRNIAAVTFDEETPYADAGKGDDETVKSIKKFRAGFDSTFPDAPGVGI